MKFLKLTKAALAMVSALTMTMSPLSASADDIDNLHSLLRDKPQVQEKIYVHTDNSSYFVGDTLWWKAYVVRADDLHPTNMSKLLYVELLSPDGYVVERQHVVVSGNGYTCGQFALQDSLYSGYYEIRAYTRWQLNFNVTERYNTRDDRLKFYGERAARDFFRDWEGLYSRVVPVYQKPKENGNYMERYMSRRPKQHVLKSKMAIYATFYPEGGHAVQGVPCTMAYEVHDQNGQRIDIEGTLDDGTKLKAQHEGMGRFTYTPGSTTQKANFTWNGKQYSFTLPKAEQSGAALHYDVEKATLSVATKGTTAAAYAILCRGKLVKFERMTASSTIAIDKAALPTGVNEVIVYDAAAAPLASRLFFVNNHDCGRTMTVAMTSNGAAVDNKTTVQPYAPVELDVTVADGQQYEGGSFSLAVRDAQTDERGYNTGNIMTDMLLSSELKGFIANADYYFASEDAKHTADLDLLMAIQGWRRYKRAAAIRYQPETGLTFEGTVNKIPDNAGILELEDLNGRVGQVSSIADVMQAEAEALSGSNASDISSMWGSEGESENLGIDADATDNTVIEWADDTDSKVGTGAVKKSVYVEAEINKDNQTAGAIATTDRNGHFIINLPAYYDQAILQVRAYNKKDSLEKNMQSSLDKERLNERKFPDYYVKRDMFFPIFSQPYSWYQVNAPELLFVDEDDSEIPENSSLAGNHTLQTVIVKSRRRGKRSLDMTKPAYVRDAYALYNDMTDYGLSWGVVDFRSFPVAAATLLCGNMGRSYQYNIRAMVEGTSFYRNYTPLPTEYDKPAANTAVYSKLRLNRMKDVRMFTDYELRTDSGDVVETHAAAVTLDFVPIENDAKRYTYRDRRYVLDGITYPEQFYSPDYSNAVPAEPKDYRRTLYWNPNAHIGADGRFHAVIYNNSRETRVTVSAEGMDQNGQLYYNKRPF